MYRRGRVNRVRGKGFALDGTATVRPQILGADGLAGAPVTGQRSREPKPPHQTLVPGVGA